MAINTGGDDDDEIMAEINMTPLIDIMLVLLIIFMVTSSVKLESGLDINLPKSESKAASKGDVDSVIVSMDKMGRLAVQGDQVSMEQLKEAITNALAKAKDSLVIFEGDAAATLGSAIEVMDIAKQAGAKKFAIATDKK